MDRSVVARQLRDLWRANEDTATELEMIAAENVFDKRLSATLARKARALHRMAKSMKELHLVVARARFPGAIKTSGGGTRKRRPLKRD